MFVLEFNSSYFINNHVSDKRCNRYSLRTFRHFNLNFWKKKNIVN